MGTFLEYVFDVITALIMLRVLYSALRQHFGSRAGRAAAPGARRSRWPNPFGSGETSQPAEGGPMARDPVCGMFVSTEVSERLRQHGKTLHFCSRECLEAYVKQKSEVPGPAGTGRS